MVAAFVHVYCRLLAFHPAILIYPVYPAHR